jgi:hypothetical protein
MNLATLRLLGFDLSSHVSFTKQFHVACSECDALVINGHPSHENRCPNAKHECAGCNTIIPTTQRYCADCV